MSPEAKRIVEALKKLKGSTENAPKGLPEMLPNTTQTSVFNSYEQEDLTDPGILNEVTGSGAGPVIGRRKSKAVSSRC